MADESDGRNKKSESEIGELTDLMEAAKLNREQRSKNGFTEKVEMFKV